MQFYNASTPSISLYHDCLFRLGIDRTDTSIYPIADFTRAANNWYADVNTWIWQASGEWDYDDTNYIDLPIATADLVNNQQDYSLPTNIQKIDRVEVKDVSGDWHKLIPIDQSELPTTALTEFEEDAGLPIYYDVSGNSLMLYPKPATASVTISQGLKLYFSREIDKFTVSDTTKEAGFLENFHKLISIGSALDFPAISSEVYTKLSNLIEGGKKDIKQFYGTRNRELKPRINFKYNKNKRL